MKKLCRLWKTRQTHLASISRVYKYLLSKQWFYTVSGPFLQIKLANIHWWNIFIIEVLSMVASPLIKMVKPPDKKPGISDRSSFLHQRSVELQHSPCGAASKACWLMWFIHKIPKILCVFAQDVPYGSILKSYVL